MTRGGSRRGKAATGRRAGAAWPCQCSGHCNTCMDWPGPLPTSCKRGSPAPRGRGTSLLGHTASRLCQRELLQALLPQPVPGKVLAGHHSHHLPGKGRGTARCGHTEPGDSVSLAPGGGQAAWTQRAGTHLVAIVHDHQVPQAQGSEELEHPWQRRLLQGRTGLGGAAASPASTHCPP